MDKRTNYSTETLLDFLDGNLDEVKRSEIQLALKNDLALQTRVDQLRTADQALKSIGLEQPSKNFTATVLRRLDDYPVRSGFSIKNSIMLLCGIMVIVGVSVILLSMGIFDQTTTTVDLNQLQVAPQYLKQSLPSIPIDGKMLVNVIVILNLALMFVVLDRAILKPLFQKRMQAH